MGKFVLALSLLLLLAQPLHAAIAVPDFIFNDSIGESTTTSTTDVEVVNITFTPKAVCYLLLFSAEIGQSNAGRDNRVNVTLDG
ncbi:MAG: hypothetical protein WC759_01210, partial [Candidatus Micrarchaeia archaeon]